MDEVTRCQLKGLAMVLDGLADVLKPTADQPEHSWQGSSRCCQCCEDENFFNYMDQCDHKVIIDFSCENCGKDFS